MDYIVGQRWISEPEPSLGLGIIIHVNARLVEVAFPAKEIVRSYAKRNAPLARVTYDIVHDAPLKLTICLDTFHASVSSKKTGADNT